jgi:hypothetical protein
MDGQTNKVNPATKVDAKPLYGLVSFKRPANATVSEKYNRKSIASINCSVPIAAIGAVIDVTIWGRLESKADGTQVTFEAGVPRGMEFPDENDRDRFLGHVETSAVQWAGYELATASAMDKLLGRKESEKGARPRLVKAVKAA